MKVFFRSIFGQSSDAVATTDTGTFSLLALVKRGLASLTALVTAATVTKGAGVIDANTQRVTLATDGLAIANLTAIATASGAPADAVATTDTGTFSLSALVKRGLASLTSILTALTTANTLGADTTATGTITTQNLVPAGVATAGSAVEISTDGRPTVSVQVTGVYTGVLSAQATVDGTNWDTLIGFIKVGNGALATIASAATGIYQLETAGFQKVRVTGLAAMTGTATVSLRACVRMASVSLDAPIPAGTNSIGTIGALVAGTNLIGDVVGGTRTTTGGLASISRIISAAASTNGTIGKASAGRLYKIRGYNAAAAVRYLKFSNSATITVGTTAVTDTFALAPSQPFDIDFGLTGRYFSTGICYGLTTGSADNDTGALTAADIVGLNVYYA